MHFWGMHYLWWIFWALLIVLFFVLMQPVPRNSSGRATPLEILQRRYAAGEMSTEEYEERKSVLLRDSKIES